jgi:ribosomal protein L28
VVFSKCSDEHNMSITPQAIRKLFDELEASRASRKRAWENLQEIRWVLKEATGIDLPASARKTIDLEGRVVKEGVRKIVNDRQGALQNLVHAIN